MARISAPLHANLDVYKRQSHHGSAVAAGQGQVFGGGTRYGYRGRGKHQGIEAGDVTRIEDAIVVPVSYTHLDVYKRQSRNVDTG